MGITAKLRTSNGTAAVHSGMTNGKVPDGPGNDIVSGTHVEGHAVRRMKREGVSKGTLTLPPGKRTCHHCKKLIPIQLGPGRTLQVLTSNGKINCTLVGRLSKRESKKKKHRVSP